MEPQVQLRQRRILGAADGPRLLVTGGVHGDEFEPMAAVRRLRTAVEPARLRGTLVLVPVVNEPAFERGERTADDGLDLARVCPGAADGSVTERLADALSEQIRAADAYVDLHTGGRAFAVLPLTGYSLHDDPAVLDCQRRMARAFGLGVVWGTGYLPGRSLSVAFEAAIPAIYAEYQGAATCGAAGIDAYVEGCLNVMAELDMIDHPDSDRPTPLVVEDDSPGAGHMQVQNPAPMTGFFEPAVRLGDRVRRGDRLGTLTDVLGDRVEVVCSQQDGIILVLRTFPLALAGESLGVVLETDAAGGDGDTV